jgi:hypothetical protein
MKQAKRRPKAETLGFVDRAAKGQPEKGRSRVTNAAARGSIVWLDHADKRSPVVRRFKDLISIVTSDLGGPTELSEAQRQLVRRIASMSVWCESQEARMADGEEIDINEFGRCANSLRRLCESIGLERRQRDVGPSLGDILSAGHRHL